MKKVLVLILSVMLVLSMGVIAVSAEDSADVYVTIADASGAIVVAAEKVTVTDADADGALTINDAMLAAHDKFYDGRAAAGYAAAVSQYGLGMTKLWGSTAGSYGYYVNNTSAWSLTDPVAAGDYIAAFVYTDLVAWSDNYSYFDSFAGSAAAGQEITLTYSQAGYDADWNPVTLPVEGAVITVDGEATDFVTDAEGKVTFTLTAVGTHLVSATVEGKLLVAPVFVAAVSAAGDPDDVNPYAPPTGDSYGMIAAMLSVMMIASVAVIILRKKYAK